MKHEEENLQIACVRWFKMQYPNVLIHHSPNGGKRNAREAARFKAMGTMPGFPDIFIAVPKSENNHIHFGLSKPLYAGLFIEMKSDKGQLTDNQFETGKKLNEAGYLCTTCRSLDEFMKIVNNYLN